MIYEPKQQSKAPEALVLASALCAVIMLAFSAVGGIGGKWLLQALAVFFFGIMIFAAVRYKMTTVRYEILPKAKEETVPAVSREPRLLEMRISVRQGRRAYITDFAFDLDRLTRCVPLTGDRKSRRAALKEAGGGKTYKYLRNIVGGEELLLVLRGEDEPVKLILEINGDGEKLKGYLSAVAGFNCENA